MGELDKDGQKSQTSSFKINKHRESLTYDDSANHFFFFTLQWCESDKHSTETIFCILNFDFIPRLGICATMFSHVAGHQ